MRKSLKFHVLFNCPGHKVMLRLEIKISIFEDSVTKEINIENAKVSLNLRKLSRIPVPG